MTLLAALSKQYNLQNFPQVTLKPAWSSTSTSVLPQTTGIFIRPHQWAQQPEHLQALMNDVEATPRGTRGQARQPLQPYSPSHVALKSGEAGKADARHIGQRWLRHLLQGMLPNFCMGLLQRWCMCPPDAVHIARPHTAPPQHQLETSIQGHTSTSACNQSSRRAPLDQRKRWGPDHR